MTENVVLVSENKNHFLDFSEVGVKYTLIHTVEQDNVKYGKMFIPDIFWYKKQSPTFTLEFEHPLPCAFRPRETRYVRHWVWVNGAKKKGLCIIEPSGKIYFQDYDFQPFGVGESGIDEGTIKWQI